MGWILLLFFLGGLIWILMQAFEKLLEKLLPIFGGALVLMAILVGILFGTMRPHCESLYNDQMTETEEYQNKCVGPDGKSFWKYDKEK